MNAREQFVVRALEGDANISQLCREFGVARKTGYKWLARYKKSGWRGLEDETRRPQSSPLRASGDVVAAVVRLRAQWPRKGPKKLVVHLKKEFGAEAPSVRTVARILERAGLMQPLRRRAVREKLMSQRPKPVVHGPNDLWTVDFKGWWNCVSGERCEPLTVRDAFSRFVFSAISLDSNEQEQVRQVFEDLFRKHGLPKAIQSDNGTPFVSANTWHGLTKLSIWWASLGIEHFRSRPGMPSDNGGHERMHRDMAEELEAFAAMNKQAQQLACDRWRHDFNHHRPHEALKMKMPAEVYHRSSVPYPEAPGDLQYPDAFHVRQVSRTGHIKLNSKRIFLSSTLASRDVGLEYRSVNLYAVWYAHRELGIVDVTEERPRLAKVA